jgi:uncharacterized protein (TIGR03435 family)
MTAPTIERKSVNPMCLQLVLTQQENVVKCGFAALILFGVMAVPLALSQSQFEFEVSSIKPNTTGNGVRGGCHGIDSKSTPNVPLDTIPRGRCMISSALLSHMIAIAYEIQVQNIKGGPDWVRGTERFDVEAKAENADAAEDQLLSMLQNFLADRFQLQVHRETRETAGYSLVVAKNGPKLKEAVGEGKGRLKIAGANIFKPDLIERKNLDQNSIIGTQISMSEFANALTNLPGNGPVIDNTGLKGFYDFKLAWEPSESLSSVLQEQLGLKLNPQKVPVDVLVIDSASRPSQN